jgi:D-glycero-beta-D-manno-heptose-7-phosphate kinase
VNELKNIINIASISKNSLKAHVAAFSQAKILVIGDLILDEYLYGYPERISREAPVLILKYLKSKFVLGGAANAANNLAALGAKVQLMGVLGDDDSAKKFSQLCVDANIDLFAETDSLRSTTTKTRIVSSSSKNPDNGTVLQQQVLRVDRENSEFCDSKVENELIYKSSKLFQDNDLLLISDYSNGVVGDALINNLAKQSNELNKKYIVDSNGDFSRFNGAFSLTPNQPDLESFSNSKNLNDDDELIKAAKQLKNKINSSELLVTRGARGMVLVRDQGSDLIPAMNLKEVFDVSGAGDTVAAAYSLALAVGADSLEAAILGNLSASLVVSKYGTATINQDELLYLIDDL